MSGRQKPSAADPREELRELTRDAHAAVKDLRQALREAREVSHRLQAEHVAALGKSMSLATAAAEETLLGAASHLQQQASLVTGHVAELLGAGDASALADRITDRAASDLARLLSAELILPPGTKVTMRDRGVLPPLPGAGQVFVVTDPADAPPGSVVIDGR